METDALDYALATILFIINEDNEVHPVAFHSCTFTVVELNYDTHDKELLLSLKLSRFGNTIWKVWPIPSMLLQIIRTLSIFYY